MRKKYIWVCINANNIMDVLMKMVKLLQTWKSLTCLNGLQGLFCS